MDQDQKKSVAAEAALAYVEVGDVVGVGTDREQLGTGTAKGREVMGQHWRSMLRERTVPP